MFVLYNLLIAIFSPIWVPWMLLRTRKRKEKPNWAERQGDLTLSPRKDGDRIWVHAVSVGEVVAVTPILRELRAKAPKLEIVLSVTTSTGHQTARERLEGLFDHLVYAPIDVPRFTLKAMQRAQPNVVAIMETELWMNFLWAAKTFDVTTALINGRISDRSFRRSTKIKFFYRALLRDMDECLMQSELDAQRIRALGAGKVEVLGNCKFDQAIDGLEADPAHWRKELGLSSSLPVVVVGSTRGDMEPKFVVDALRRVGFDNVQVVHAPRHLETADELERIVREAGGQVARRSRSETGPYLILDTLGELSQVYSVADVAIIGGGFDKLGGQNLIQPLAHGVPVLHGPNMQNFRDVTAIALEAGASETCATEDELAAALTRLLGEAGERVKRSAAAKSLVASNVGASARYAARLVDLIRANPRRPMKKSSSKT